MTHSNIEIWNSATGITDLESDGQALSASETPGIRAIWNDQRTRLKGTAQLSDFTEKFSREWAIETGVIENLYEIERGVTQTLIERGFQAEFLSHGSTNHPREYVLQLLRDQKDALDGVFDFGSSKRALSVSYIKELHAALLRSQDVTDGVDSQGRAVEIALIKGTWKTLPNYPVRDGVTYSYCAPEHVAAEMDRLVAIHSEHIINAIPSEVQAASSFEFFPPKMSRTARRDNSRKLNATESGYGLPSSVTLRNTACSTLYARMEGCPNRGATSMTSRRWPSR